MEELHGVLLLPGRSEPIQITLPINWDDDFIKTLITACKDQKDESAAKSVEKSDEIEVGSGLGRMTILYCVHGGDPKAYGLEPNPFASKRLNRANCSGPFLCVGVNEDDGETKSLTVKEFMSICDEDVAGDNNEFMDNAHVINCGPVFVRDQKGVVRSCDSCDRAAVEPVIYIRGILEMYFCQYHQPE